MLSFSDLNYILANTYLTGPQTSYFNANSTLSKTKT